MPLNGSTLGPILEMLVFLLLFRKHCTKSCNQEAISRYVVAMVHLLIRAIPAWQHIADYDTASSRIAMRCIYMHIA